MPHEYIVGPETGRMLELGHPWVIADRYTKKWPQGKTGAVVRLFSAAGDFLASALLAPGEKVVARVLSRDAMTLDRSWVTRRIESAVQMRRQLEFGDTTAYRLVNGEGDGLPGLTVDRYDQHLLVQIFTDGWRPHLPMLIDVLQKVIKPEGIYEKRRPRKTRDLEAEDGSKKYSHLLAGQGRPGRHPVRENGLNFLVDLETGLDTGLFFDQRENRRDLMSQVPGKTFLNLFSYTGAFSVAAAAAQARHVTSVDASGKYLEWAKANFAVNRLNPKRHEFIGDDCFAVLDRLAAEKRMFDIILFDPPSFSTTRKSTFSTRGGTADLVAGTLPLLRPGGLLIGSSNHQKTDLADYLKEFRRGALRARSELKVVGIHGQPGDFPFTVTFPEGRYLKLVRCIATSE